MLNASFRLNVFLFKRIIAILTYKRLPTSKRFSGNKYNQINVSRLHVYSRNEIKSEP